MQISTYFLCVIYVELCLSLNTTQYCLEIYVENADDRNATYLDRFFYVFFIRLAENNVLYKIYLRRKTQLRKKRRNIKDGTGYPRFRLHYHHIILRKKHSPQAKPDIFSYTVNSCSRNGFSESFSLAVTSSSMSLSVSKSACHMKL